MPTEFSSKQAENAQQEAKRKEFCKEKQQWRRQFKVPSSDKYAGPCSNSGGTVSYSSPHHNRHLLFSLGVEGAGNQAPTTPAPPAPVLSARREWGEMREGKQAAVCTVRAGGRVGWGAVRQRGSNPPALPPSQLRPDKPHAAACSPSVIPTSFQQTASAQPLSWPGTDGS